MKKCIFLAVMLLVQASQTFATRLYTEETIFITQLKPPYYLEDFSGDQLKVRFTGNPVMALGGIFANTDINPVVFPRSVNIELSDGTFASLTGSGFRGFTRSVAVASSTNDGMVISQNDADANWPSLADFYVGSVLPERDVLTLLILGGLLVVVGYRLRSSR